MEAMLYKPNHKYISEEQFNEVTLKTLKENKEGITEYPVLDFDEGALDMLSSGVKETLKSSKVKVAGGKGYEFLKRLFDIVMSFTALLVLAIPLLIIALIIFLGDKGNPIFSQVRLTKEGKPFRMYKLRSMCVDAEAKFAEVQKENKSDGLAFKSDDDPRITKIGKFIRKTSIDELPQLFNILKGEMSLVGPRPERPFFVEKFREEIPRYMVKHQVRPGLTGWAQVNGYRGDTSIRKRIEYDLYYIENWSIGLDIKIIFLTFFKGFINKNAY